MLSETRERFLRAILQQVPMERIAEIHFFPAIRQGGVESGVAVVAAKIQELDGEEVVDSGDQVLAGDEAVVETDAPAPEDAFDEASAAAEAAPDGASAATDETPAPRFTVFTARYRLVLKGPDRGKWDAAVVAEADAPLVTVDAVVRGVQRRSGESDAPERMSGDELRAALEASTPR